MSRKHTFIIALVLAVAAIAGLAAVTRTTGAGASAHRATVSKRVISQRSRALDRFEAALRRSLAKKPPRLPAIPVVHHPKPVAPAAAPALPASAPAAAPVVPRVMYVRAAPIIVHKHRAGGERDHEHDHEPGDTGSRHGDD